jgi:hypothetical protein
MPKQIFIIHFLPIEGYPPILNLLDFFSDKKEKIQVNCSSTKGQFKTIYANKESNIKRFGKTSNNKLSLWFSYFAFNITNIFLLLVKRPKNVMYYETISSLPAYVYKKYINKKANLFIHYHEYTTKQEYLTGSPLNRYFHKLEQQIYKDAKWISHTNEVRLNKFLKDNNITFNNDIHKLNPNYPSKIWGLQNEKWDEISPIKLVFAGYSVDPNGCFILELIEWLSIQKQHSILDIYCIKQNSLPSHLIGKQGNTTVNTCETVAYQYLPPVLKNYHVGLILYRGLTPNYIYNAPNKLFEYLACGLDVWFPQEMKGCQSYIENNFIPQVLELNYNALKAFNLSELINNNDSKKESIYYYEYIYDSLFIELA